MKLGCKEVTLPVVLLLLGSLSAVAGPRSEEVRSFDGIEVIRINTISGDCIVRKSATDQVEVEVIWSYRPRDSFEPKFRERGKVLRLNEDMYGSNSGRSTWTLTVPDGIEIRFSTASGDMELVGLSGEFSAETASGDIQAEDCKGEFDLSSASGDVDLIGCEGMFHVSTASGDIETSSCQGEFELSTASGTVEADGVVINEASSFSTASGRVRVTLAETSEYDLRVSTASGRATLDYGGNPVKGYFEFTSRDRNGRIVSPFDFDDEESFRRWGDRYVRKWFTRETDSPQIFIETASGKAVLREG